MTDEVTGVCLRLQPSDYHLMHHDRGAMVLPLWEDAAMGYLVWCRMGVRGDGAPADIASGHVPCKWRDAKPDEFTLNTGGIVRGEYVTVRSPARGTERTLVVRAPDGLMETKEITVFETLELVT